MSSSGSPSAPQPDSTMSPSPGPKYGTFSDDLAATSNIETVVLLQPIGNFSPRRRRARACICLCIVVPLFVVSAAAWLLFFWSPAFGCFVDFPVITAPNRKLPQGWSAFRNQSWAVGFDLTAGYGTSSIAFNNGTIIDVVKRQQGTKYNNLLARVSREEARHPTPPYYNCTAIQEDVWRQWNRWWRRSCGMPSSDDVEALWLPLLQLKTDTNAWLREREMDEMQVVFVTVPLLPAMYMEDLVDAAALVGLQLLALPWSVHSSPFSAHLPVADINTAFAGMGLGLNGIFPSKNETEAWSDNIFSVLFTKGLTAHVSPIRSAPHFFYALGIANFSLGLEAIDAIGNETYWHAVRSALNGALEHYLHRGNELGRVIVHGEAAENDIFQGILREEVAAAQWSDEEEKQPRFWSVGPVFAGSRGAAIFGNWCQRGLGQAFYWCFPNLTPEGPPWF
jgi:uncharacterized membrane protein